MVSIVISVVTILVLGLAAVFYLKSYEGPSPALKIRLRTPALDGAPLPPSCRALKNIFLPLIWTCIDFHNHPSYGRSSIRGEASL